VGEPLNSLEGNIVEFADILRRSGIRVGTSEIIDSIKALEFIDVTDRHEVRLVLASCLAKSRKEQEIFFKSFDIYFVPPAERNEYVNNRIEEVQQKRQDIIEQASELEFQGAQINISDELKEVYANLQEEEKEKLKDFLEKTSTGKNVRPEFMKIAEDMVRRKLSSHKLQEGVEINHADKLSGALPSEIDILTEDIRKALLQEEGLIYKNIGDLKEEDIPKVIAFIREISEAIKRDAARRLKRSTRKVKLDLRKTIRSNLSKGGILFDLKFKKRSQKRTRYLLLCDVSASMYRFSGFVLQFILGMHEGNSSIDTYVFSESIERFDINSNQSTSEFEARIKKSDLWLKGTNINQALRHFLKTGDSNINSSTVLLIVSDAKTLEWDKAVETLGAIEAKVKKVFWLNPIPETSWNRIPGIEGFEKLSTMLDCSTLERLSAACRKI
jgi:uncharacterized protein